MTSLPFTRNCVLKGPEISNACAILWVAAFTWEQKEKEITNTKHQVRHLSCYYEKCESFLVHYVTLAEQIRICGMPLWHVFSDIQYNWYDSSHHVLTWLTFSSAPWLMLWVGSIRVASPEWTPASSTCSVMAWATTWTDSIFIQTITNS